MDYKNPSLNYQANAWGYARASHRMNSEGDQIPAQVDRAQQYYVHTLLPKNIRWGGYVEDPRQSASKKPFFKRPGAKKLIEVLQPGDHIIVDKVDRILRRIFDWADTQRWCDANHITMHIVNMAQGRGVSTDNALDMLCMTMFVAGAEFESRQISDRIKSDKQRRIAKGHFRGGTKPMWGTKIVWIKKEGYNGPFKTVIWDKEFRGYMDRIVELHDGKGVSFTAIARRSNREEWPVPQLKNRQGKSYISDLTTSHFAKKLYVREKVYRMYKVKDPASFAMSAFHYPTYEEVKDKHYAKPTISSYRDLEFTDPPANPNPYSIKQKRDNWQHADGNGSRLHLAGDDEQPVTQTEPSY